MQPGDKRTFKHLGEIQEFAETYEHNAEEFKFKSDSSGQLEMTKL